jgi:transcriptional regulator with XRE-family HTH domain
VAKAIRTRSLGGILKAARQTRGMSQLEVAYAVGVDPTHVTYLEADQRHPSLPVLSRLVEVLGLGERAVLLAYPEVRPFLRHEARGKSDPWRQFIRNKELLARHHVKSRELRVLAQINRLGRVAAASDFPFILNSIRQAMEPEDD